MLRDHLRMLVILLMSFSLSAAGAKPTLLDIKSFTGSELAAIKRRYPSKENSQVFSREMFATIAAKNLGPMVGELLLHPKIRLEQPQEVVDFATKVVESGFDFRTRLGPRIERYIKRRTPAFIALDQAIERERQAQWRQQRIHSVTSSNRPFVASIRQSRLSEADKQKVIRVYALCIASYENATDRAMLQPQMCDPALNYPTPRYKKSPSRAGRKLSPKNTEHAWAYKNLTEEARRVADFHDLNDFERIMMAKCVGEKSLRFFIPSHHPLKTIYKEIVRHHKTPDEAFFMRSGICSNFSAITYNVARQLGLDGQVFLVRKGAHVYLEFRVGKGWYHTHPFNPGTTCAITRYASDVLP